MESQNPFNYFKIPFQDEVSQENKLHIIGVIDCSGSMGSWWKNLAEFWNSECIPKQNCTTITFDTSAKIVPSNILKANINEHGGGGTNISEPFVLFEKEVEKVPKDHCITAIFISDGQDNNIHTLDARLKKLQGNLYKKINFICLGIEKGFPTFISMSLRQLYHRGDDTIPALYLIEFASDKAFFNKFEGMKKYFYSAGAVALDPPVCVYVWDESVVDSAYEGAWVIAKSEKLQVGQKIYDVTKTELGVQDLVDIFRGWVQALQLTALSNMQEAQKNAQVALKEMDRLTEKLSQRIKIDIKKAANDQEYLKALSFYKKASYNFVFRYGNKISWFLQETQALAEGKNPKFENEFEAAKRMNIGTITGKYHQKALALKAMNADEFARVVKEFAAAYKESLQQNNNKEQQQQEPIVMAEEVIGKQQETTIIIEQQQQQQQQSSSLQQQESATAPPKNSQKYHDICEVLAEPDFLAALEFLKSPYDLFESFPLQGLAMKLKRYDGANENPWLIETKYLPKCGAFLDLSELTKNLFLVPMEFDDKHKEEVNCILPLFNEQRHAHLRPLLTSRLFKLMTSYIVMQNADVLCDDAYLALLTSAVAYLLRQAPGAWRNRMLQLCLASVKICYGQEKAFQVYAQQLCLSPAAVFGAGDKKQDQQEEEKKQPKPQLQPQPQAEEHALGLPLIHALVLHGEKGLPQERLAELFTLLFLQYFRQLLHSGGKVNFFNIVKPDISEALLAQIREKFLAKLDSYFCISDFRKDFAHAFAQFLSDNDVQVTVFDKAMEGDAESSKFPLEVLQNARELCLGSKLDEKELLFLVFHAHIHQENCFAQPVSRDYTALKQFSLQKLNEETIKTVKGFSEFFKSVDNEYARRFQQRHFNITPFSKQQLQEKYCKEANVDFASLQFDPHSGLVQNACQSPQCPFFLQVRPKFKLHLDSWQGKLPIGFHRFVKARLAIQNNEELFAKAQQKWKMFPENYNVDKAFVLDYVQKLKDAFAHQ